MKLSPLTSIYHCHIVIDVILLAEAHTSLKQKEIVSGTIASPDTIAS